MHYIECIQKKKQTPPKKKKKKRLQTQRKQKKKNRERERMLLQITFFQKRMCNGKKNRSENGVIDYTLDQPALGHAHHRRIESNENHSLLCSKFQFKLLIIHNTLEKKACAIFK